MVGKFNGIFVAERNYSSLEEKINYIDAICQYCEMNDIEIQSVSKLVTKPLKERLKYDAIQLNFMKKTSRAKLPL